MPLNRIAQYRSAKKSFCCNYPNYTHQIQITAKIGIPFRSNNIRLMEKCLELFNSWLPGCPPVKDTLAHRATTTKITIFNNIFNYLNEIQFKLFSMQFYLNSIHNRTFKLKYLICTELKKIFQVLLNYSYWISFFTQETRMKCLRGFEPAQEKVSWEMNLRCVLPAFYLLHFYSAKRYQQKKH